MKLTGLSPEEEVNVARRNLLWWWYKARDHTRQAHQGLPRDVPEGLLGEDDLKEAIALAYQSEYESEQDDDGGDCEAEEDVEIE